jgi:hypothetical protein
MSYHLDHNHTTNIRAQLSSGSSPDRYAAVVGTIVQDSERPITGRSGDHLQFYVNIGGGARYQVDVNTQSSDGSITASRRRIGTAKRFDVVLRFDRPEGSDTFAYRPLYPQLLSGDSATPIDA